MENGRSSSPASSPPLVFRFAGQSAGTFTGLDAYPTVPGRYRYEPFRSLGHYKLGEECARAGFARCAYRGPEGMVWFDARSTGEYGLLDLGNFGAAR